MLPMLLGTDAPETMKLAVKDAVTKERMSCRIQLMDAAGSHSAPLRIVRVLPAAGEESIDFPRTKRTAEDKRHEVLPVLEAARRFWMEHAEN
jgi:hypothetical protein